MCKFSSKSGGVPFQISLFLGDLTRNDPVVLYTWHKASIAKVVFLLKQVIQVLQFQKLDN